MPTQTQTQTWGAPAEGFRGWRKPSEEAGVFMARVAKRSQFFKTRMCPWVSAELCSHGDSCAYAHSPEELRSPPDLTKTRLCPRYLQSGQCSLVGCRFAHSYQELRATDAFKKTRLCQLWSTGKCAAGANCRLAHGIEELRRNPIFSKSAKSGSVDADENTKSTSSENQMSSLSSKCPSNVEKPKRPRQKKSNGKNLRRSTARRYQQTDPSANSTELYLSCLLQHMGNQAQLSSKPIFQYPDYPSDQAEKTPILDASQLPLCGTIRPMTGGILNADPCRNSFMAPWTGTPEQNVFRQPDPAEDVSDDSISSTELGNGSVGRLNDVPKDRQEPNSGSLPFLPAEANRQCIQEASTLVATLLSRAWQQWGDANHSLSNTEVQGIRPHHLHPYFYQHPKGCVPEAENHWQHSLPAAHPTTVAPRYDIPLARGAEVPPPVNHGGVNLIEWLLTAQAASSLIGDQLYPTTTDAMGAAAFRSPMDILYCLSSMHRSDFARLLRDPSEVTASEMSSIQANIHDQQHGWKQAT